jgi:protocatechuate 3,4-dioxygenase beta subunit
VLAAAAGLGLLALVFVLSRDGGRAAPALAPLEAEAPLAADPAGALPRAGEDARRAGGPDYASGQADGIPIPYGVRLRGPGQLAGRVLDRSTGARIAGARVDLLAVPPLGKQPLGRLMRLGGEDATAADGEPVAVTGSSADGAFVFEGVRPGRYFLQARGARHVPDAVALCDVLASGAGGPVDVWVRAGGRVVGEVLLPDGRPAASARVFLTPGLEDLLAAVRSGQIERLESECDELGRFALPGAPVSEHLVLTAADERFALAYERDVAVRAGEDTRVVLKTTLGGSIEGRVVSVAGAAEPGPGTPIPLAGAYLAVIPRGLRDLQFAAELLMHTYTQSRAEGRFLIERLPAGEFTLVAIAAGHVVSAGPAVRTVEGGLTTSDDFELPRGPVVSGRVVDASGAPVAGVRVSWELVQPTGFGDFLILGLSSLLEAAERIAGFGFPRTDAEGRFTAGAFPGDPPYAIEFKKAGHPPREVKWNPAEGPAELEVVLGGGGAVEGIVMDGTRSVPVPRFSVASPQRLEAREGAPAGDNPFAGALVFEDAGGRFSVPALEPGKATLVFEAPGYLAETVEDVAVTEGQTTRGVIVTLTPGARVRGSVTDTDGRPVVGAQVLAQPAEDSVEGGGSGRPRRRQPGFAGEMQGVPPGMLGYAGALGLLGTGVRATDAEGRFELDCVEPGRTVVVAAHRDFVTGGSAPVQVEQGGVAEVVLELSRGGGVYGRARDRFDRPVGGSIVVAMSSGDGRGGGGPASGMHQGSTNERGEYRIEHMAPGSYFLVLTRGDDALVPTSFFNTLNFDMVTVPAEEMVEFDILDSSVGACRVYGSVTAAGTPVRSGQIVALGFGSDSMLGVDVRMASVRSDGTYEFAGLAPGEYQFDMNDLRDAGGERVNGIRLTIDVPDLAEYRLDLAVPEGEIAGRVVDAVSGAPIAGARVMLDYLDREEPQGVFARMIGGEGRQMTSRTDEEGRFSYQHLQGGGYEIGVRPPSSGESGGWAPGEPLLVQLREGGREDGVVLRLRPELALTGQVVDESDAPVAEAFITAVPAAAGEGRQAPGAGWRGTSRSQEGGGFRIGSLAPGDYELVARKEGFARSARLEVKVTEEGSAPVRLVLRAGASVTVRVLGTNGQPVSGAVATLQSVDPRDRAADAFGDPSELFSGKGLSDAEGLIELGRFAEGEYVLEARRSVSRSTPRTVTIPASGPVEFVVRLE